MAIPGFQSIMLPLLRLLGDGDERSVGDMVETLSDDFDHIREHLGLGAELSIPRANVSKTKVNLADFYTSQADLDYIYDRYEIDFDTFGYERLNHSNL